MLIVASLVLTWFSDENTMLGEISVGLIAQLQSVLNPTTSSHIRTAVSQSDLQSLIFVGKLIALLFHSIARLGMAERACASLITSFDGVPSLVCVDTKYLN